MRKLTAVLLLTLASTSAFAYGRLEDKEHKTKVHIYHTYFIPYAPKATLPYGKYRLVQTESLYGEETSASRRVTPNGDHYADYFAYDKTQIRGDVSVTTEFGLEASREEVIENPHSEIHIHHKWVYETPKHYKGVFFYLHPTLGVADKVGIKSFDFSLADLSKTTNLPVDVLKRKLTPNWDEQANGVYPSYPHRRDAGGFRMFWHVLSPDKELSYPLQGLTYFFAEDQKAIAEVLSNQKNFLTVPDLQAKSKLAPDAYLPLKQITTYPDGIFERSYMPASNSSANLYYWQPELRGPKGMKALFDQEVASLLSPKKDKETVTVVPSPKGFTLKENKPVKYITREAVPQKLYGGILDKLTTLDALFPAVWAKGDKGDTTYYSNFSLLPQWLRARANKEIQERYDLPSAPLKRVTYNSPLSNLQPYTGKTPLAIQAPTLESLAGWQPYKNKPIYGKLMPYLSQEHSFFWRDNAPAYYSEASASHYPALLYRREVTNMNVDGTGKDYKQYLADRGLGDEVMSLTPPVPEIQGNYVGGGKISTRGGLSKSYLSVLRMDYVPEQTKSSVQDAWGYFQPKLELQKGKEWR